MQEAFFDVLKTVPLLLAVYALLYYIENRLTDTPALLSRTAQFGPAVGALAGSIPQCRCESAPSRRDCASRSAFSAAASALFSAGYLAPATLVAVFLATSDEAVPVMLAGGCSAKDIIALLAVKFILAALGGYLLRLTVFRRREVKIDEPLEIELNACGCGDPLPNILGHTLKTALFLFAARLASVLLGGSIFQPLLCAVLGLVPSCAMSVLLSELYVGGAISFGALVAGLSTGAGFGYIVLLGEKQGRRKAAPVILATFVLAALGGTLTQLLLG